MDVTDLISVQHELYTCRAIWCMGSVGCPELWHVKSEVKLDGEGKEDELTTVVSRYYDTAGIRKKYHNIETIKLTNF